MACTLYLGNPFICLSPYCFQYAHLPWPTYATVPAGSKGDELKFRKTRDNGCFSQSDGLKVVRPVCKPVFGIVYRFFGSFWDFFLKLKSEYSQHRRQRTYIQRTSWTAPRHRRQRQRSSGATTSCEIIEVVINLTKNKNVTCKHLVFMSLSPISICF